MRILATLFITMLATAGVIHIIEVTREWWAKYGVIPLNFILMGIAVIIFYMMVLYAIWNFMPVG